MWTLCTFTFAQRLVQYNIAHRLGTEIFTGNASIFDRWQLVLMPRISGRFEGKPVYRYFLNGDKEL